MNALLDIVERLTSLVEELNPGETEQIRRIRLLIERARLDEEVNANNLFHKFCRRLRRWWGPDWDR